MNSEVCARCGKPPGGSRRRGMCKPCNAAHRNREIVYGRWDPDRAAAEPVREWIATLKAAGVSYRRIAELSETSRSALCTLLYGKPGRPPATWVSRATAAKILAVEVPTDPKMVAAPHDVVPAIGVQRRLRALVSAGWPMAHLATELGMTPANFAKVIHDQHQVTARVHRQVVELFGRLQLQAGPSQRARNIGLKRKWPLPMQWDEEALDDPAAAKAVGRRPNRRRVA